MKIKGKRTPKKKTVVLAVLLLLLGKRKNYLLRQRELKLLVIQKFLEMRRLLKDMRGLKC